MVILSFSVPFLWDMIWDGKKTRTMRAAVYEGHSNEKWSEIYDSFREYPLMHINLDLWWKSRSPKRVKLFTTRLKNISMRALGSLTEEECKFDGFKTKEECLNWFRDTYNVPQEKILSFRVFVIEWMAEECKYCSYMFRCKMMDRTQKAFFIPLEPLSICPQYNPHSRKTTIEFPIFEEVKKLKTTLH